MSCAQHLAWGYVDQPPLIAVIAKFVIAVFGTSLYALRLLPALAAATTVVLVGRLVRRLDGGVWAQMLAMLAIAVAPFSLAVGSLLTMNAFESLLWLGAAYLMVRALEDDRLATWSALGCVSGIGLINKYSMAFFLGACIAGIALTTQRRALVRRGFFVAVAIALAIVAPTLVWQAHYGWPQLELLHNAAANKNVDVGIFQFCVQQLLMMGPLAAPLWLIGFAALIREPRLRPYRWYAFAYLVLSLTYVALQAKVYYLAPVYPLLFAVGAVVFERSVGRVRTIAIAYPLLVFAAGLAIAPEAVPVLPLPAFLAYQRVLDVRGVKIEKHPTGIVPQQFADMFGWEELVAALAAAYDGMPPAQRREAVILTHDYGQASAVDFFGPARGLPHAVSGHNNYYLYGLRGSSGKVVIAVGIAAPLLRQEYASVRQVGVFRDRYVLPDSDNLPIYVCTKPREPLGSFWPHFKRFI